MDMCESRISEKGSNIIIIFMIII